MARKEDEFGLDWGKTPFERGETVKAICRLVEKTENNMRDCKSRQEKTRFRRNAIQTIQMILDHCAEAFFINELDGSCSPEVAWQIIKTHFFIAKIHIENPVPYYLV